jgi:plasmid stabilization system protein ParE
MTYSVTVLARARQDVWEIHDWIAARSPDGAERWLDRFDKATNNLRSNPLLFPLAPESGVLKIEIRHVLFRTRQGRTYRAIFTVTDDLVRILRVRGAGQPPVKPEDIIL